MKKPLLLTLCTFFLFSFSFAQSSKHHVGFMIKPGWSDVSNRLLDNSGQDGGFALSTGIFYDYKLGAKMKLHGGIAFSMLSESNESNSLRWGSEHDGLGGWAGPDPNLPHGYTLDSRYYFLDVSAGMKFYFNESRFQFFVLPYLEMNIFLSRQGNAESIFDNGIVLTNNLINYQDTYSNIRNPNLSAGLGVGVEAILSPKFSMFLMPYYEYMLLSMGKEVAVSNAPRFFNLGAGLGVSYRL